MGGGRARPKGVRRGGARGMREGGGARKRGRRRGGVRGGGGVFCDDVR